MYKDRKANHEAFEELVNDGVTMFAVTSGECGECGGGGPYTADEVRGMDFPPFHINCGCSVESWTEEEAKYILEQGSDAYFAAKEKYGKDDRGVGYIQLTHRDSQLAFLADMGSSYTGVYTAEYIADNYDPWMVSAYVWTQRKEAYYNAIKIFK